MRFAAWRQGMCVCMCVCVLVKAWSSLQQCCSCGSLCSSTSTAEQACVYAHAMSNSSQAVQNCLWHMSYVPDTIACACRFACVALPCTPQPHDAQVANGSPIEATLSIGFFDPVECAISGYTLEDYTAAFDACSTGETMAVVSDLIKELVGAAEHNTPGASP